MQQLRKILVLGLTLISGGGLTLGILFLLGGQDSAKAAPAAVVRVCPSCRSDTIQEGVDEDQPNDIVQVASGTYSDIHFRGGVTQVVYISKPLTIQGGYVEGDWSTPDPVANPTIINAGGQGRGIFVTGNYTVTIDGFEITQGDATDLGGEPYGTDYDFGGGVYVYANQTGFTLQNCLIHHNTAERGAGMYLYYVSPAVIQNNVFYTNTAVVLGGGFHSNDIHADVTGNIFKENSAGWSGGGINLFESNVVFINNVLMNNKANVSGGGVYASSSAADMIHTTIVNHSGSSPDSGSGLYLQSSSVFTLTNTIIAYNQLGVVIDAGVEVNMNSTLWYGNTYNYSGSGTYNLQNNYFTDPLFTSDGYHLSPQSGAKDVGIDAGVDWDIDGDPRPMHSGFDLGADEIPYAVFISLVMK